MLLLGVIPAISLKAAVVDLSTDGGITVSAAPNENGTWASNTAWYKIKINGNRYWSIGGEYTDGNRFLTLTNTTAPTDPTGLWCVVGDATNGYKFYNMAMGTSFVLGTIGKDAEEAQTRMVSTTETEGRVTTFDFEHRTYSGSESNWCIKDHGTSTMYFNFRNPWLAHWNSSNAVSGSGTGSEIVFEAVTAASAFSIVQSYKTTVLGHIQNWKNVPAVWSEAESVYNTLNSDQSITVEAMAPAISNAAKAFVEAVNNKRVTLKTLSTNGNRNNLYMSIGSTQCLGEAAHTLNQIITLKANYDFSVKLFGEVNQKFLNFGRASSNAQDATCFFIQVSSTATSSIANVVGFKYQSTGMLHMQNSGSNFVFMNLTKADGTSFDEGASRWTVSTDISQNINAAKPVLTKAITFYNNGWLGEGVGKYTYTPASEAYSAEAIITSAQSFNASTEDAQTINLNNTNGLGFAYTGAKAILSSPINQPTRGKVYRFQCVNGGKWLSSSTNNSDKFVEMSSEQGLNTYFYLNENNQLLSYNLGQYTGNIASPNMKMYDVGATTINTITFKDIFALSGNTDHLGSYGIYVNNGDNSRNLYGQWSNVNSGAPNTDISGNTGYHWKIVEVKELPIVINQTYKLGTFYSPVPLTADNSKLKFFTGSIDEEGYLTLTRHDGNIPAQTPFLIELQDDAEYNSSLGGVLMTVAASGDPIGSTNSLQGHLETKAHTYTDDASETTYTLQLPSNTETATTPLVFRKFSGTKLQGFRAYLEVSAGSPVRGMRFGDDITDINNTPSSSTQTNSVYDLSGRRIHSMSKGLYIVNGKKLFIK